LISSYISVFILYLDFSQVYKSIFTSPSSAKNFLDEENDTENMVPTKSQKISSNSSVRRNVASKLHLNKVTPRSVAYAAVQACVYVTVSYIVVYLFVTASSILICKLRVHGLQFMVDLTTMDCITISLISLRIPQGLLQRSVPKSYSIGGQCEVFPLLTDIRLNSLIGKFSQPPPFIDSQTSQPLVKHLRNNVRPLNVFDHLEVVFARPTRQAPGFVTFKSLSYVLHVDLSMKF
jgi:hypothetical protein